MRFTSAYPSNYLGVSVEQRDRAAADRRAADAGDKKPDIGLEHLFDREAVPLVRLVDGAEHLVEFRNQFPRVLRRTG
jgi:hypothetical protein